MAIDALQRRLTEALVAGTRRSPRALREAAAGGPARGLLAGRIFAGMAREFDGERGADIDAVVRWEVGAEGEEPEVWELVMREGRCRAVRDSGERPRTTLALDHRTLLELAVGLANGPQVFTTGRLRMRGDVMLAQRMTALFRVPGGAGPG